VTGSPKARYGATFMTQQQMDAIQKLFDGEPWTHMGIKSAEEVAKMKVAGAIGAHVLDEIYSMSRLSHLCRRLTGLLINDRRQVWRGDRSLGRQNLGHRVGAH
jgi:hypothetical protein